MGYFNIHNHTDIGSNNRFLDSMNNVESVIDAAYEKGLTGLGLTDHQALSSHIKAEKYLNANPDKFKDFKVTYGDEIYLVDRETIKNARENNIKSSFYHFLLTAKNQRGYHFLRELSSLAWRDSFFFRGMRRLPTYKDWLETAMKDYKGDVIASTACLGSELSNLVLQYNQEHTKDNYKEIEQYVAWLVKVFGQDNLYLELMPSESEEQKIVNNMLLKISAAYHLPYIISTDSHYVDLNDQNPHETFLKSENANRDVKGFYEYAHLFSEKELHPYFSSDVLKVAKDNSNALLEAIEPIVFKHKQEIPVSPIPEFKTVDLRDYDVNWKEYPLFEQFANAKNLADRYYLYLLFKGMEDKNQEFNHVNLSRINDELNVIKTISDYLGSPMSQYFLTTKNIIDTAWETDSLVGPGRGSVGCFYTAYLLDITEINAIEHDLPYWRFLSEERKDDMPDIDLDTESSQRLAIIEALKESYGHDHVLNFCTFNKQAARSTILTACRGLGIGLSQAKSLVDLLPKERMETWSIEDALYGNKKKDRKPDLKFSNAIKSYYNLERTIKDISGKVRGVSQHASGVVITNEPYTTANAMMMTAKGLEVTQFEAHDSEYAGNLKYDILTLNALDRIHEAIRLLLKDNKIEWQGSLRKTYEYYFDVEKLEMEDSRMFDMLFNGEVVNAFEFSTPVGWSTLQKLNARTFDELIAANALMRLTVENGEQPIDKYMRYRDTQGAWDKDMEDAGLSSDEIDIMYEHLGKYYGVCYSQESLMSIAMDPDITGFSLLEANKLRKSIAKKDEKLYDIEHDHFFNKGRERGTSERLLEYVWRECAEPAKYYSFNLAHGTTYTLLLMIEMNICLRYGVEYWQTACLSVNSGIFGNEFDAPDYAKLAKAAGDLPNKITDPDINNSDYGFKPYNDKILYGLYPISTINKEDCDSIISNRPYQSFDDFLSKSELTPRKIINLIKAGCFDSFGKRREIMIKLVDSIVPKKKKLTTVQIPKITSDIPEQYQELVDVFNFRGMLFGRNKKPMTKEIETKFFENYEPLLDDGSYVFDKGVLKVNQKVFDRWYKKQIKPLSEWLKTDEAIQAENNVEKRSYWIENCFGNQASWEFEAIGSYVSKHELELTSIKQDKGIASFNDLTKIPFIEDFNKRGKKRYPVYATDSIYGTVIDKNTNKNLVTILTPDGVVNVRLGKRNFITYNQRETKKINKKSILLQDTWLKRGTKLMVVGYRRGNDFIANSSNSIYNDVLYLIKGYGKKATLVSRGGGV